VTWLAVLDAGFTAYLLQGRWMPYIGQFVGSGGLGPPDVLGSRARLLDHHDRIALTIGCGLAAVVVAILLSAGFQRPSTWVHSPVGVVVAITGGQALGVLPPSFHYLHRGYALDRYLLPLLPLGIALALWATRDTRLALAPAWLAVAAFALVSVIGTRDYLTYLDTVWAVAGRANAMGVPNEHLDAGAAWDGYHLYTLGLDQGITKARTRTGPWWVYFYGKPTDSTVVVAGRPLPGFVIVAHETYDPWWGPEDTIYLLARPGYRITP
jgi:hypothetical protein